MPKTIRDFLRHTDPNRLKVEQDVKAGRAFTTVTVVPGRGGKLYRETHAAGVLLKREEVKL